MKRCFVAMRIANPARDAILAFQQELARVRLGAREKLRLTKPDNLHLTMKFLGATADAQVEEITAALELVASSTRAPAADLLGVGAFPSAARPRAIFAAVGPGRERIVEIAQAVEEVCSEIGFASDERPRVPHVTLARAEQLRPRGPVTKLIEREAEAPRAFGRVDAGALVLYESSLRPGGSIYTPLATLHLSA